MSPHLSQNGFLPEKPSLEHLPERGNLLNKHLNDLIKNLPALLEKKELARHIDELNHDLQRDTLDLRSKKEQDTAILILSMLVQAYIFNDPNAPRHFVPEVIANNLNKLCYEQQRFPIVSYVDYILNNWKFIDPNKGITLENIEPLYTFTNSKDEAGFIKIHVAIEAAFAPALHAVTDASLLADSILKGEKTYTKQNEQKLIASLKEITQSILDARGIIRKMSELCDPEYFYNILRPYMKGWNTLKTVVNGKEQSGVEFKGILSTDIIKLHSYKGPSGAQSSIVPALDAFFGVKHTIDGMFMTLHDFQQYMPSQHQAFINNLSGCQLQLLAHEHEQLNAAFTEAVQQLIFFRSSHMNIVHKFVLGPAKTQGVEAKDITGTGGAPIHEYLNERLNNTAKLRSFA